MEHIVRIGLSRRAQGLTRAAAQAYWRTVHADLFRAVPRLLSYVQNHAVLINEDHASIDDCPFDIFAEVGFETEKDLAEAIASEYYRTAVLRDEVNLLVSEGRSFLLLRRNSYSYLREPGPKLVAFLSDRWRPGVADGLAPTMLEPIEGGSGPVGQRAQFYAQWHRRSAQEAFAVYEALFGHGNFSESLVAATVVRPNVVVNSAAIHRPSAT